MLTLVVPAVEIFNDDTQEFELAVSGKTLRMEHSLISLSKWESLWHKPFLSRDEKTTEETLSYMEIMTITQNVDPFFYRTIPTKSISEVNAYIENPMSATTFPEKKIHTINNEIVTSEIIYYWMVALTIPFECQKWHLNRLLTLINVCNIKNQPKTKRTRAEIVARNHELNEARKKKFNTKG